MVVTDLAGLVPIEPVRCLDCGEIYAKPCGGNTIRRNPGCPGCGYVGWISAFVPVSADTAPRRAGDGRRRHRG
jgi:predicted  nucleic acid-binding Zn-ribbon protein